MSIPLYTLLSPVHDEKAIAGNLNSFLETLQNKLGDNFKSCDIDSADKHPLIFIKSGGVEGYFKKIYKNFKEPYILLTNGMFNSFAASLEILTFLKQKGLKGEIIHGDFDYISNRIQTINKVIKAKENLSNTNIGIIGKPSDWLISSNVDYSVLKNKFNINAVEISMNELLEEFKKPHNIDYKKYEKLYSKNFSKEEVTKALNVYYALKNISNKYNLKGLTIRCFDLLDTIHTTGCIALSLLNDEGIVSSCEGDVPALISMMILNELTHKPVFMANPSSIDTKNNTAILAHCTIPLCMTNSFSLDTHFESGIGVGIHGNIPEGRATIFKLNANLNDYFVCGLDIMENLYEKNLCRTQIKTHMDESVTYFLKNPMGNHHLICTGDYSELVREFFTLY